MRVLFIGSNPSQVSPNNKAFDPSTRSGKILSEWISHMHGSSSIEFINVSDTPTPGNKSLSKSDIKASLPSLQDKITTHKPDKIIALGKTASNALTLLRLQYLEMPHPSGCNFKLNDPNYVVEKIKGLVEYTRPSNNL